MVLGGPIVRSQQGSRSSPRRRQLGIAGQIERSGQHVLPLAAFHGSAPRAGRCTNQAASLRASGWAARNWHPNERRERASSSMTIHSLGGDELLRLIVSIVASYVLALPLG